MPAGILSNTPTWVWGLLAALILLGLAQIRSRSLSLRRACILPTILCGLSLVGTLSALSPHRGLALAAWLLSAAVTGLLVSGGRVPAGTRHDPVSGILTIPGSGIPLLLMLGIFLLKYVLGVAFALQPELAESQGFAAFTASLYGVLAGVFGGRAVRLVRFTRGHSPPASPIGPLRYASRIVLGGLLGSSVLMAGAVAFGTSPPPPPLPLISQAVTYGRAPDLPPLDTYLARDGTPLAYRAYRASTQQVAVLIHGSSGDSHAMHALGRALADAGITAYALDLRGHGASGRRGDIDYVGQLDDDLADFLQELDRHHPAARRTLIGHSSGGGFTLRIAGGPQGERFDQYVMLAPMLHPQAPTTRPNAGGWVRVHLLRLLALRLLDRLGLPLFQDLPVLVFALPPEAARQATLAYSDRLQRNFRPREDFRSDVRNIVRPSTLLIGAYDELFVASQYAPLLAPLQEHLSVRVLPGIGHLQIVAAPGALTTVVQAVNAPSPPR